MLILTRKIGESIIIRDDIVVTILGSKGGQIKVGISAPENVNIVREELLLPKIEENRNQPLPVQYQNDKLDK